MIVRQPQFFVQNSGSEHCNWNVRAMGAIGEIGARDYYATLAIVPIKRSEPIIPIYPINLICVADTAFSPLTSHFSPYKPRHSDEVYKNNWGYSKSNSPKS